MNNFNFFGAGNNFGTGRVSKAKAEDTRTVLTISVSETPGGKRKGKIYLSPKVCDMLQITEENSLVVLESIDGQNFFISNISSIPGSDKIANGSVSRIGTFYNLKLVTALEEAHVSEFPTGEEVDFHASVVDRSDTHGCPTIMLTKFVVEGDAEVPAARPAVVDSIEPDEDDIMPTEHEEEPYEGADDDIFTTEEEEFFEEEDADLI